jgi:hypothetical protein
MQNDNQNNWIFHGATILNVAIEFNYRLNLGDGTTLSALARFPTFGAPNGMLIFTKYDQVKPFWRHLGEMGYGFSVLDTVGSERRIDIDSYRAMLIDWGWSGYPEHKPDWII